MAKIPMGKISVPPPLFVAMESNKQYYFDKEYPIMYSSDAVLQIYIPTQVDTHAFNVDLETILNGTSVPNVFNIKMSNATFEQGTLDAVYNFYCDITIEDTTYSKFYLGSIEVGMFGGATPVIGECSYSLYNANGFVIDPTFEKYLEKLFESNTKNAKYAETAGTADTANWAIQSSVVVLGDTEVGGELVNAIRHTGLYVVNISVAEFGWKSLSLTVFIDKDWDGSKIGSNVTSYHTGTNWNRCFLVLEDFSITKLHVINEISEIGTELKLGDGFRINFIKFIRCQYEQV